MWATMVQTTQSSTQNLEVISQWKPIRQLGIRHDSRRRCDCGDAENRASRLHNGSYDVLCFRAEPCCRNVGFTSFSSFACILDCETFMIVLSSVLSCKDAPSDKLLFSCVSQEENNGHCGEKRSRVHPETYIIENVTRIERMKTKH